MAQTITSGADITVQASNGDLLAVVEVRNWREFSHGDAALVRHDLAASNRMSALARFFIFVARSIGYFWDQNARPSFEDDAPFVAFPTAQIVEHYIPSARESNSLMRTRFKLAIEEWLSDIAHDNPQRPREPENAIARFTDFTGAMRNARVDAEPDN